MAVDLSLVARLEEFPRNLVEIAGDHEVVQYRGEIMPLIRVSEKLVSEQRRVPELVQDSLHVVVYSEKGRSIGLVVDRILDIVEESFAMQRQTSRKGIGSAVIQKHTTDILDVPAWSPHRKWPRCSAQHRVKGGAAVANTQQFCTFFWHDQCFGVPVEQVQEVIRYEEMTRVPLGPDVARASSICVDRLTNMLASRISSKSELPVRECVSGEAVAAGHAVIAPGDFHMAVQQEVGSIRLKTHQGPRENFCRPSVDVLFRSVAQVYGERAFDGNGPGRIERLRNVKGSGSSSLCSR